MINVILVWVSFVIKAIPIFGFAGWIIDVAHFILEQYQWTAVEEVEEFLLDANNYAFKNSYEKKVNEFLAGYDFSRWLHIEYGEMNGVSALMLPVGFLFDGIPGFWWLTFPI